MDELGFNSASLSISVISYVIYSKTRGKLHSKFKVLMMLCLITCFVCFFHPLTSDLLNGRLIDERTFYLSSWEPFWHL